MIEAASESTKHKYLQKKTTVVSVGGENGDAEAERKAKLKQIRLENKKLLDAIQRRKEKNMEADEGKYTKKGKPTVVKVRHGDPLGE